jgi:pectate lyase
MSSGNKFAALAIIPAFALTPVAAQAQTNISTQELQLARETASLGWATMEGGTTGGSEAGEGAVHVVSSRAELVEALGGDNSANAENDAPAIVFISGTIDLTEDDAGTPLTAADFADPEYDFEQYVAAFDPATYGMEAEPEGPQEDARARSQKNQAAHTVINIGSNKTIFGLGDDAMVINGTFNINEVSNVIVRNILFADSYDLFPAWDGTDGDEGNWNSAYDLIQVRESDHVWIDHNTFSDGERPDHLEAEVFGRKVQHHDGAVDVVNGSSFVTLTNNHIQNHDKTHLIGSSDSRETDRGQLKVTLAGNWYENSGQRSPRVRFGEVHVFKNLYEGSAEADYPFIYALAPDLSPASFPKTTPSNSRKAWSPAKSSATTRGQCCATMARFSTANPLIS